MHACAQISSAMLSGTDGYLLYNTPIPRRTAGQNAKLAVLDEFLTLQGRPSVHLLFFGACTL
jgi:hypothetical protein